MRLTWARAQRASAPSSPAGAHSLLQHPDLPPLSKTRVGVPPLARETDGRSAGPSLPPSARPGRCGRPPMAMPDLLELVYELLDAHADTVKLAGQLEPDEDWRAHLEYLRALQRHGRRMLAETTAASIGS